MRYLLVGKCSGGEHKRLRKSIKKNGYEIDGKLAYLLIKTIVLYTFIQLESMWMTKE